MKTNDSSTVIAIDIGSTNIHLGIVDTKQLISRFRVDFPLCKTAALLPDALGTLLSAQNVARPAMAVIGGGHSGAAAKVERLLKKAGVQSISHVKYHTGLPLRFSYVNLEKLGADRIAHALYAHRVFPDRDVIVISSGTAITIDAIDKKGGFSGGIIMAGADAQLQILHSSTNVLPQLSLSGAEIPEIGSSTESCMIAGTAHGIAGAMERIVGNYQKMFNGKAIVLATGGAWEATEKLVNFPYEKVPDMTLIGTALFL
jgi:type III pantothenate kinase